MNDALNRETGRGRFHRATFPVYAEYMTQPFLIDAHSHINFSAFAHDAAEVVARAEAENIWMLAVGSQIDTSRRAVAYAATYEHVWAVVGLHPIHLIDDHVDWQEVGETRKEGVAFHSRSEVFDPAAYRTLAQHSKVVAIGECGLDRYRIPAGHDPDAVFNLQETAFRQQIALARECGLPLMVHVRDGAAGGEPGANTANASSVNEETIRVLSDAYGPWSGTEPRGIMHCYSGTWDQAQRYLALGFNISFTGVITFTPTKKQLPIAEELRKTAREVPLDRFHVETDCPYLTPEPHRSERNEPRYVRHIAEKIAELREVPLEKIAAASVANTLRVFRKIA